MKKGIILGIGILIILLALAGTGSAKQAYTAGGADCSVCHTSIVDGDYSLTTTGSYFRVIHKFNGNSVPYNPKSCLKCHADLSLFELTTVGSSYNTTHRFNETTLASQMLTPPGCGNCHVDVINNNFDFITDTPTYLGSTTCEACHKTKYDKWSNTLHAVMLTPRTKAEAMGLPLPPATTWDDISNVLVTKFELAYINSTGYFLPQNDAYNTETKEFENSRHAGGAYGTCAKCHTTGYNASGVNALSGITGTFEEPGIACERCHGAAGNGHQVTVTYSSNLCEECHTGSHHGTGWSDDGHAKKQEHMDGSASCTQCHSPYDKYTQPDGTVSVENATAQACGVCHNTHDMTDNKYAETFTGGTFNATAWSEIPDAKLGFFNATASIEAGKVVFDDLTKDATADLPVSGVLCAKCHYRHGLAHMPSVDLSHGIDGERATCVDCHMEGANAKVGHDMMKNHDNAVDSGKSCGGTKCHGTSDGLGSLSMQKRYDEWGASAHNVKEVGVDGSYNHFYGVINETTGGSDKLREASCNKCHDPMNYNPALDSSTEKVPLDENFKGVTCTVCHNIHDMGDWFAETNAKFGVEKAYGLFEKVLVGTRYKGSYKMVENTTALCGSCHASVRIGRSEAGWPDTASKPNHTHGFPAADIFAGSWKQTAVLEFECTSCHYATLKKDGNGTLLPQNQRIRGHSFQINTTLLQSKEECSSCHVTGSKLGNISTTIENVQTKIHERYNATNVIVTDALAEVKAYSGENTTSREKIAQAYWNIELVKSDNSWGAHNPAKVEQLLDDAQRLSSEAIASLGMASDSGSRVSLKMGWNLVALTSTPAVTSAASVMDSVKDNIAVVWGYNDGVWELYDPAMPAVLNDLKTIVPGKGYWIFATTDVEWTA